MRILDKSQKFYFGYGLEADPEVVAERRRIQPVVYGRIHGAVVRDVQLEEGEDFTLNLVPSEGGVVWGTLYTGISAEAGVRTGGWSTRMAKVSIDLTATVFGNGFNYDLVIADKVPAAALVTRNIANKSSE